MTSFSGKVRRLSFYTPFDPTSNPSFQMLLFELVLALVLSLAEGPKFPAEGLDGILRGVSLDADTVLAVFHGRVGVVEGPDEFQFGLISDLDVDDQGTLFVVDRQLARVQVYDSSGNFQRTIGRKGMGPGEFIRPRQIAIAPDGSIVVSDDGKGVFSVFTEEGNHRTNVPLSGGSHYFDGIWVDRDLRIYDGRQGWGIDSKDSFIISISSDPTDEPVDTIPLPIRDGDPIIIDSGNGFFGFVRQPLSVRTMWAVFPDGGVVGSSGTRCEFSIIGINGTEVFSCDFSPVAVPADQALQALRDTRQEIQRQAQIANLDPSSLFEQVQEPTHFPSISHLTIDREGRIWLAVRSELGAIRFGVFDRGGDLLAEVHLPQQSDFDVSSVVVGGGWLYGRALLDPSLGVQEIRRFRIPAF
jgi:hypothetical protein